MAIVASRPITAEEFYEFVHRAENRDRIFELDRGEIIETSQTGKRHGLVCGNAAGILWAFARQRKRGYVCSNDTGLVVTRNPDTVRGPDLMFFEDAALVEDIETTFATNPPLVSLEVMSPNDSIGKVNRRIQQQLRCGVQLVWLLDPEASNVTVYRLGREPIVLEDSDELSGENVLPGFSCKVAEFFTLPGQSAKP